MNENGQDKVIAFDTLFTTNQIQMLKILMPYFDRSMQKNLAIYIKYLELQYTLGFFKKHPTASIPLKQEPSFDIPKLCSEVMPYCGPKEKARMESMRNMYQTFENYKEMMEMVQMMQEIFPEGENPLESMGFGMDSLAGMEGLGDLAGFDPSQLMSILQAMSGMTGGDADGTKQSEPSDMDGG